MKKFFVYNILFLLLVSCNIYSQPNIKGNTNIVYLSPVANSQMNSPSTNIIIRTQNILKKETVNSDILIIKGSVSGTHLGNIITADDGKTLVYNLYKKFTPGENVSVYLKQGLEDIFGNKIGEYNYNFTVSNQSRNTPNEFKKYLQKEIESANAEYYKSSKSNLMKMQKVNKSDFNLPSDFPQLYISVLSNPDSGYIFLSNFDASGFNSSLPVISQPYLMILDNSGRPFFYKKMSKFCIDFKLQPNGLITYFDSKIGYFYALNNQFSIVDSFYCGNGFFTDFHELQILPNGHYLVIGYDDQKVDMSKIVVGGDTNATVMGKVIQELDENKYVVFQWRSWDHYNITDATDDISLTDSLIDYVHTNAIELDTDGNILISNRHMDEVTKINRETGDIIWRLGGKNNEFTFINDNIGFSHQHDIRRLSNGDITLFDNGNLHYSQLQSRAVEYKLDEQNKTAELVWQFRNTPDETAFAMGDVQRLSNGNSIIGWGAGRPAVTEVTLNGLKEFELSLAENVFNYRAFRFKLDSSYSQTLVPAPELPLDHTIIPDTMLMFKWSKNKFAQSFHFQLSKDPSFVNLVFEDSSLTDTALTIDSLEDGIQYYWHILSDNNTDSIGGYAGYSNLFSFTTLLKNPSNLSVTTSPQANFLLWDSVANNADSVIIERKGGSDTLNYKIVGEVSKNKNYFLDESPDTVNVISNQYMYRIKLVNQYSYSDYVYSPIITWSRVTDIYTENNEIPKIYSLKQNYPNPFNPNTTIEYAIPKQSNVTIIIFDLLGREVMTLVNEVKQAGNYKVKFNAYNLPSGVYIYRIKAGDFVAIKKLILLK